jgi:hypothetical protein
MGRKKTQSELHLPGLAFFLASRIRFFASESKFIFQHKTNNPPK